MGGWVVCTMIGVVIIMGEVVLFGMFSVYVVAVAGGQLLGSGRMGVWVGRLVLCFAMGLCCWGRGGLYDCCPDMLVVVRDKNVL